MSYNKCYSRRHTSYPATDTGECLTNTEKFKLLDTDTIAACEKSFMFSGKESSEEKEKINETLTKNGINGLMFISKMKYGLKDAINPFIDADACLFGSSEASSETQSNPTE